MRKVLRHVDSMIVSLAFVAVACVALGLLPSPLGCATSSKVIQVAKDCAVSSGQSLVPQAVLEVETAVAQSSQAAALGALEALAGQYGVSFVSCVVERIVHDSAANLARNNSDGDSQAKAANGALWLARHPH